MTDTTLPWFVAGPLIGLVVPLLLLIGNRSFGMSSNLRHLCAAIVPATDFFRYDWKRVGAWNLVFLAGVAAGAFLAGYPQDQVTTGVSEATRQTLASLGLTDTSGLVPAQIFSWEALGSWRALLLIVGGGFLVGFGTAWAGGCTSGHAIAGLAALQLPSLIATFAFFGGGLLGTWVLLPLILQ
jgi:uncharacterized protein